MPDETRRRIAELKRQTRELDQLIEKANRLRADVDAHLNSLRETRKPAIPDADRRTGGSDRRKQTRRERRK